LQDFNDGCFFSITWLQWWSVLFGYEFSMRVGFVPLIFYEISKTVFIFFFPITWLQWWSVLCLYEISMTVGFTGLWDFNDGRFCWVMRFQWRLVLFFNKNDLELISKTVIFFFPLHDFIDGQFCSFTRFQWWSVLFCYEMSMIVIFAGLWVLFGYEISMTVTFQCQSVLFSYEISKTVGFAPLFFYEISKTDSLVSVWDFYDSWFCPVTTNQWRSVFSVSQFRSVVRFQ